MAWRSRSRRVRVAWRARPCIAGSAGRTGGPAALGDHPRSGRRRKLDAEQRAEVKAWVLAGPDVERDGVVAWRGGDARAMVEGRLGVKLALSSTIGCWASCTCRPWCRAPATAAPTGRHRPPFSKLPGPRKGDRCRLGTRHPGRGLVQGLDACWPEGHADPGVGRDRLAPSARGLTATSRSISSAPLPEPGLRCALILPRCDTAAMTCSWTS